MYFDYVSATNKLLIREYVKTLVQRGVIREYVKTLVQRGVIVGIRFPSIHASMRKSQLGGGDERTLPHFFIFRPRRARGGIN